MATAMITGGKLGDILGRRRAFTIGLIIYGAGSALTAVSWSVPSLLLGWSILEGLGAALVLPALVALIAANYEGRDRVAAFGVIGGVAGVGIAAGPIIGGYFTTNLSWRWVFVGEVLLVFVIIASVKMIEDAPLEGRRPRLDWVGSILSASGLGLIVFGILQATKWAWVIPKNSPIEPFGFSLTLFVIAAGFVILRLFVLWQERREHLWQDRLVKMELFQIPTLRAGLSSCLLQNIILLGVFFTLPLHLQVVLGYDALETGLRMLPISIAMFITSSSGPALAQRFAPRRIVQTGFALLVVAAFFMLGTIEPVLDGVAFGIALSVLGVGMGLVASQLGNIVQSSVGGEDRGEAGGLQYTAQQLGSAIGTALIGGVVISALIAGFVNNLENDPRVATEVTAAIEIAFDESATFASTDAVEDALSETDLDETTIAAILEGYRESQLGALKAGLLIAGFLAMLALAFTRNLPAARLDEDAEVEP